MMSRARARQRDAIRADARRARAAAIIDTDLVQVVPGVIPENTPEWQARALRDAHAVLLYVAGTRVTIGIWDREPGLALIRDYFGPGAVKAIAALLDEHGPAAKITLCMRKRPDAG